jgi:two-component system cell cycle sensor histidine kinase/response regulator CckA
MRASKAAGDDRMAELFAAPMPSSTGETGKAVLYLVDVSEQKALETNSPSRRKCRPWASLAGGVAHDFNNLLTVIIGNCEFLLMRTRRAIPHSRKSTRCTRTRCAPPLW